MAHSVIVVGLDVHAAQTHAAQLDVTAGELAMTKLTGGADPVIEWLGRLGPGVRAVYEAGPTGFGLARAAAASGLDVRVVSPGLIPKRPTDRVKTDRRDAIRLARLAAGELSFVRVPTLAEEQFRDLIRAREDLRTDLMRARHRLSKFLLRRKLVFPGPGGTWTQAHMTWLARLSFDDVASQTTMIDYLAAVQALVQRRGVLETTLERLVPDSPYATPSPRCAAFVASTHSLRRGCAPRSARLPASTIPNTLAGFLGIVPSEHTSDTKRRQGAITKAGPGHARRLLVNPAHHYRCQPRVGVSVQRRQTGQDPRVCDIAWRAQIQAFDRVGNWYDIFSVSPWVGWFGVLGSGGRVRGVAEE